MCLGYGLRLSWPGKNNTRRSLTAHPRRSVGPIISQQAWVNTYSGDVDAYYLQVMSEEMIKMHGIVNSNTSLTLANKESSRVEYQDSDCSQFPMRPSKSPRLLNWMPYQLNTQLGTLLRYCKCLSVLELVE